MDKQIEEMAREIAKRDCYLYEHCPKQPKHNCVSQDPEIMLESSKKYITIAIWLVNAGYRKIPEGAVVLTKEEYDELQKGIKTYNYTAMFDAQSVDRWEQGYSQGTKETAEKFAEMANERIAQRQGERDGYEAFTIDDKAKYDGDIVSLALFEICKEITEGQNVSEGNDKR